MKVLITGSNGLLGQKLVRQLSRNHIDFLATSQGENRNSSCENDRYNPLDICDLENIERIIESYQPTHVIHTAAITNVDFCELNAEACDRVNHLAVKLLFEVCAKRDIHFQLLSTDFVFDGQKGNYNEEDEVNPLSLYAESKVNAENVLKASSYKNWSIVRTIIVYGTAENLSRSNLIYWAKEALESGKPLSIVDDQFRAPTWADDLAWGCIRICALNKTGVFHLSGPETYSIYEIVLKVGAYFSLDVSQVKRSTSEGIQQPAKRPPRTGFDLSKSKHELGYSPQSLEETFSKL